MANEHLSTPKYQIIYLNGPSSSGKTSLVKALQEKLSQPFLHVGIDKIIGMMPAKLNDWTGGEAPEGFSWKTASDDEGHVLRRIQLGPFAKKISSSLKDVTLTLAKEDHCIIIDDVAFGKEQVDLWREKLRDYPVLWVGINCSLETIEEREQSRGDRILGSGRHQYFHVHEGVEYDFTVDTSQMSIEQCADQIYEKLFEDTNYHEIQQQLTDTLELLKTTLGDDLLGVYLFGSSLVGGLQKYSDIDLLAVTNRVTTPEEKKNLVANLLQISGIYMKSSKLPLEVTLVEKAAVNPWRYPPHFDFQYGEWLRTSFEKGIVEPSPTHEMPDLALIITQVLLKNQTLWGSESERLLPHVPYHDFMKAMLHDLNRLATDLEHDTRNVLLTYARIWSTLTTDAIRSKPAAADWVINHLPKKYQPVMERAKSICIGVEGEHWDDVETLIKPCANFMVDKINAQMSAVNLDNPTRSIKLAEGTSSECSSPIFRELKKDDGYELRAICNPKLDAERLLVELGAELKSTYAFTDFIFKPACGNCSTTNFQAGYIRLRHYAKTQWNQKVCEVWHKVFHEETSDFAKQEFDSLEEGLHFLEDRYTQQMKYYREGKEYTLKGMSLYLEEIEGAPLTLEVLSSNKKDIENLFQHLQTLETLPYSVPEYMQNLKESKA